MNKITEKDIVEAATLINVDPAAIKAVCEVEAPRGGFNPDGTPVTLFEGHWFYKLTGGIYAQEAPDLCYPNWTREFYGKTFKEEQARLKRARQLDLDAALQSASWGRFQIMGFNWNKCGFRSLYDFCTAMREGEVEQLNAFINFIDFSDLEDEMQRQDWAGFARQYNGPRYKENNYDTKLAAAYKKFGGK